MLQPGDPDQLTFTNAFQQLDEIFAHPGRYQEQTLRKILEDNAACEYLLMHGLEGRADKNTFKQCLPLISYEDVEPFIQRIADGDTSPLLTSYPVVNFALSSGTSGGKSKMIPVTTEHLARLMPVFQYSDQLQERTFPESKQGKRLSFAVAGQQFESKGGFKVGTSSTNALRSPMFRKNFNASKAISPFEVILCGDFRQATYCHLLCGLLQASEVRVLDSIFAFLLVEAFRTLERCWQELCDDIRTGRLSARITDAEARNAVSTLLEPNPELAAAIHSECSKSSWHGIVRRLWPNARLFTCIATGPVMRPYVSHLNYYSADLPILTKLYGATEGGLVGVNMDLQASPNEVSFTMLPFSVYMEFIPVQKDENLEGSIESYSGPADSEQPVTKDLEELEQSQYYEIVITSFQGLYRYRLGDVMRVTGFDNKCPRLEYVCRRNVLLGLNTDKTDELELQILMEKGRKLLQAHAMDLDDYTSYADHSTTPGHYVIFWELKEEEESGRRAEVLQECCCLLDSCLNNPYQRGRKAGTIGPLELRVVKKGSFTQMMEEAMKKGAGAVQYKPPRCIVSAMVLELLNRRVEASFSAN